jgi:FMN phosphatase YigB (HAD superfamily)
LRCAEREGSHFDKSCPVKLIVFDLDETLTMATFMTADGSCLPHERDTMMNVNFESPWVDGKRIEKLKTLFEALQKSRDGSTRFLAILTRNANAAGVLAVVNLLKVGGLDENFCTIWTMPWRRGKHNGAYRAADGSWDFFNPPIDMVHDHKADVLKHVANFPDKWFPQLCGSDKAKYEALLSLKPESVVLVDDQRANFQSPTGASMFRYCKVARYDASYRSFGLIKDMGGIGAHSDADYDMLKRFVEDPWMCKETLKVRCNERDYNGCERRTPVALVVFDFDETLTLATFMPTSPGSTTKIGWKPEAGDEWSEADLREYNFESPWVEGSRLERLAAFIAELAKQRKLAVLTRNECGVVAVLNLLRMAGLAEYFSAIWTMSQAKGMENGAFQDKGQWTTFHAPIDKVNDHKADVIRHVAMHPEEWFPQLRGRDRSSFEDLLNLQPESVVLIDDERANFRSYDAPQGGGDPATVLRYCKVARYDDEYRDCGLLNQMGGLGAHNHEDYQLIKEFLDAPWDYPYERICDEAASILTQNTPTRMSAPAKDGGEVRFTRTLNATEERSKAPRKRSLRPS